MGQGVLQGSSSAAPIFILNSDVSLTSLTTYQKLGKGVAFCHHITKEIITDKTVQNINDNSQFANPTGTGISTYYTNLPETRELLHSHGNLAIRQVRTQMRPQGTLTISGDKGKQNLNTQCTIHINPCAVAAEIPSTHYIVTQQHLEQVLVAQAA